MRKTTVYLPDGLKRALEQAAAGRGRTVAELIREALQSLLARESPPAPRLPLFKSGRPGLAERVDEALAGFGET